MGPKKSDIERKISKAARQKRYHQKRVSLGTQIDRWKSLKDALGTDSDSVVAKKLIDFYLEGHDFEIQTIKDEAIETDQSPNIPEETAGVGQLSGLGSNDTDTDSHYNRLDGKQTSTQRVPKIDIIQGLPLNVPFNLDFTNPKSYSGCKSKAYILVEYTSLCQTEHINPVHLGLRKNLEDVAGSEHGDNERTVPLTNENIVENSVVQRVIKVEDGNPDSSDCGFNEDVDHITRHDNEQSKNQTADQESQGVVVIKTEPNDDGKYGQFTSEFSGNRTSNSRSDSTHSNKKTKII